MTNPACSSCGGPAGPLSTRFGVPDAMIGRPLPPGVDPYRENFMPVRPGECYIRALLTIPLAGKPRGMLYCAWLLAPDAEVRHVRDVMWDDEAAYAKAVIHGRLANALPGPGCLGAEVTAVVRDVAELPRVTSSADPELARILSEPQPYETAVPLGAWTAAGGRL